MLLLLRFLLTADALLGRHIPKATCDALAGICEVGTYVLTVALIWVERKRIREYHIDLLAVMLIVVLKPIETLYFPFVFHARGMALAFPKWPSLVIWVVSIVLLVGVIVDRKSLPTFTITPLWGRSSWTHCLRCCIRQATRQCPRSPCFGEFSGVF